MISIVIPTYRREQILLDTINFLVALEPKPAEIILVDQTPAHQPEVAARLAAWQQDGRIRLIRQETPSIPRAMNAGLRAARSELVLFLDDDIEPDPGLVAAHLAGHRRQRRPCVVAGRVLQPWHEGQDAFPNEPFHFASTEPRRIETFMGGNVSMPRSLALTLGGFDENFVRAAYNFEAEFAFRLLASGHAIHFEPRACIRHLRAEQGGTRSFGGHLRTMRPDHAVGGYYLIMRTWRGTASVKRLLARPLRAVMTRHHLRRPWWIPVTLIGELRGFVWALRLATHGPRYVAHHSGSDRSPGC